MPLQSSHCVSVIPIRKRCESWPARMRPWWFGGALSWSAIPHSPDSAAWETWNRRGVEQASHLLDRLAGYWSELTAGEEVRDQAVRMLGLHPLRAADALQLAAALVWADRRPLRRHLTCLDDRLRDAARREGFIVLPRERD